MSEMGSQETPSAPPSGFFYAQASVPNVASLPLTDIAAFGAGFRNVVPI
jgi:hypothetical protein